METAARLDSRNGLYSPSRCGQLFGYGIPAVHLLVHYIHDLAATAVTLDAPTAFFSTDNKWWTLLASVVCSGRRIGQLLSRLA